MKRLALALFSLTLAAAAVAQEVPAESGQAVDERREPVPVVPRGMEDVVKAAKEAKAARDKNAGKKKKVITNADVKKSTAKLGEYVPKELPAGSEITVTGPTTLERHDARLREVKAAEERVAAAEKKVKELEKDLNALELSFYEENDPNYRDGVIQQRFAQTRRQLDGARSELADARDAANALAQQETRSGPEVEIINAETPPQP